MYNECFSHMGKMLQKDISFSHKVQMVQAKMHLHLNVPVYSLNSPSNIKDESKINNQSSLHATYSHKQ